VSRETTLAGQHEAIRLLLEDAGFDVERTWMDDRDWYAVTLARVGKTRNQYDVTMSPASAVPHVQRKPEPVGHRI